jgi:chromosome segregation ATPase
VKSEVRKLEIDHDHENDINNYYEEGRTMDDICELSSLLQQEEYDKTNLEKDIMELETSIQTQEHHFEQEVDKYHEVVNKSYVIKSRTKDACEIVDIVTAKLEQLEGDIKIANKIANFTRQINEFITLKNILLIDINNLETSLKSASHDADELLKFDTEGINSEIENLQMGYKNKQLEITSLQQTLVSMTQRYDEHSLQLKINQENLDGILDTINSKSKQMSELVTECTQKQIELDEIISNYENSKSEQHDVENNYKRVIENLKLMLIQITNELNSEIRTLNNLTEEKNSVLNSKINIINEIESIKSELNKAKSRINESKTLIATKQLEKDELLRLKKSISDDINSQKRIATSYRESDIHNSNKTLDEEILTMRRNNLEIQAAIDMAESQV